MQSSQTAWHFKCAGQCSVPRIMFYPFIAKCTNALMLSNQRTTAGELYIEEPHIWSL